MKISLASGMERLGLDDGLGAWILPAACVIMLSVRVPLGWVLVLAVLSAGVTVLEESRNRHNPSMLDAALLMFYASCCVSTVFAYDVSTALIGLNLRTLCLLLYLASRGLWDSKPALSFAFCIGAALHCAESIRNFARFYQAWAALSFSHLVDFRSFVTLTAAGVRPGNHYALYIIGLTLGIYRLQSKMIVSRIDAIICGVAIITCTVCVLLSFSRVLYVCTLAIFLICAWNPVNKLVTRWKIISVGFLTIVLVTAAVALWANPVIKAIGETVQFNNRVSQQQSASGRLGIGRAAAHLAIHCGLVGKGIGNYALEVRHAGLTSPSLLTAHAFNVLVETTIEQGHLGLATLLFVLVALTKRIYRGFGASRDKALLAGLVGLTVYGMNQSFVVADQATAVSLAVFLSVASGNCDEYA